MPQARLNHVSVLALDLEESTDFYVDVFDMEKLPTANFEVPVQWLQAGDCQLHLFEREMDAVPYYHFGLTVENFEEVYQRAKQDGLFANWDDYADSSIYRLPDGAAQMYLNDPAGNLIEVDYPDLDELDQSILDEVLDRRDLQPQTGEAARATIGISD
jgi:catechol 2,3-dioxygenase-like lactoylglutathione lyase family enzyme